MWIANVVHSGERFVHASGCLHGKALLSPNGEVRISVELRNVVANLRSQRVLWHCLYGPENRLQSSSLVCMCHAEDFNSSSDQQILYACNADTSKFISFLGFSRVMPSGPSMTRAKFIETID
jgi:hypothetical protein